MMVVFIAFPDRAPMEESVPVEMIEKLRRTRSWIVAPFKLLKIPTPPLEEKLSRTFWMMLLFPESVPEKEGFGLKRLIPPQSIVCLRMYLPVEFMFCNSLQSQIITFE